MNDSTDLSLRKIPNLVTESDDFRVDDIQKYVHRIREIKEELETHLIYVRAQLLEIVKSASASLVKMVRTLTSLRDGMLV